MQKIKITKYGTIHYVAQCTECDWCEGLKVADGSKRNQKVRNKVYRHIRQTGHRVQVEGGTSTDYELTT